jgi:hypothetical protein
MRTIPVCFSLAILFALTQGVRAADAGKGGHDQGGGLKPIIKPIETVVQVPITIVQGVVSPLTKPKG